MDEDAKLYALNSQLLHCRSSAFYKGRIPDKPLSSIDELKNIPITTKEDIRNNSPFGLVCVPERDLFQYHESFGTTGIPAATWLTREDFIDMADCVNEGGIDFNDRDIVLIRFPYAISTVAHFVHAAAQRKNACVIPASSRTEVSPFPRIVNLLRKLNVTVLAAMPLQAILIAETAEILGLKPDRDFPNLRMIYTAGEVLTPQKRRVLEKVWGVPVSDNYGMTETGVIAVNCESGVHHPLEDRFIFEVLDDSLKNSVEKGEIGNLVITTLKRKGTPLIRYHTGDRVRMVEKTCSCGKHTFMEIHGRIQDTVYCSNRPLDIWDIAEIVSYLPCQRFWIAGQVDERLKIIVEEEKNEGFVEEALIKTIEEKYKIGVTVDIVKKGTLVDRNELLSEGSAGKPKYIYTSSQMKEKGFA